MTTFFLRLIQSILYWEASLLRKRYTGPVITVSGSVGKTSTKEVIGQLVRNAYGDQVIVTPKSFNTEIGVPLTMLGFRSEPKGVAWLWALVRGWLVGAFGPLPKCMVLEIGTDRPGDIAYLSRLVLPTHAVITNVSEEHSQNLGSLESIQREEASILEFVSLDGMIIVNGDDPFLAALTAPGKQPKVVARLHTRADYFASSVKLTLDGTEAILHHDNRTQRIRIARLGEHHLYSVLFAAAVADDLGISRELQVKTWKEIKPLVGRGTLIPGKQGSYIFDESYNAQPQAMHLAIGVLAQLPAQRRIAILGDMRELLNPEPVHQEVGRAVRKIADYVIAVGPQSRAYKADEWFMTAEEAIPSALRQLSPGAIVLVKGSQNTIRLERVVKALMLHPTQAAKLLARQEPEWQKIP